MDVYFASTNPDQDRIGPLKVGGKSIVMNNGFIKTTDKEVIKGLLQHPFYHRNKYELQSNPELVGAYLENDDEPDYIDENFFDNVTKEGIIAIGKVAGAKNQIPTIIKNEVVGVPVTSEIEDLKKEFMIEPETETEEEDEAKEEGTKKSGGKKKTTTKKSSKKKTTKKKSKNNG